METLQKWFHCGGLFFCLTNFLSRRNGRPGSDVETYNGWHTGHVSAASLTVLHKDVDLTGLKPDGGIYPDNAAWPGRVRRCHRWTAEWMTDFYVSDSRAFFLLDVNTNQSRTAAPREPTARSTEPSLFMSIVPWMLRPKYCRPGAKSTAAILWETDTGRDLSKPGSLTATKTSIEHPYVWLMQHMR